MAKQLQQQCLPQIKRNNFKIPYTGLKSKINSSIRQKCQKRWTNYTNNTLLAVKPFLGERKEMSGNERKQ